MRSSDHYTNSAQLTRYQYNTADKLSARIRLHQQFSTNKTPFTRWLFEQIKALLTPSAYILELGSGRGDLWRDNHSHMPVDWDITLSDLSPGMLADNRDYLGTLAQRMAYNVINAQAIPYPDQQFDAVIANYMLYHVPDRGAAIREIRRVLKPDGILIAATNGKNHMAKIYTFLGSFGEAYDLTSDFVSPFSLQNGTAQLMRQFTDIQMRRMDNDLWVTDAEAIIAYIQSMFSVNGSGIVAEHEAEMRDYLNGLIEQNSGILIEKETGVFIARGTYG